MEHGHGDCLDAFVPLHHLGEEIPGLLFTKQHKLGKQFIKQLSLHFI